jgi:riboflavin kinase / FMN adenylyltransferase
VQVFNNNNIPNELKSSILTVGTFDGLHLGHKHVIETLKRASAPNIGAHTCIITFSNHPRSVLFPQHKAEMLSTLDEKLQLFESEGVDFVYLIEFSKQFASLSPYDFVNEYIVPLNPLKIIIGRDHFFGKNKEGDVVFLEKMGEKYGFEVQQVPAFYVENENVSSSSIRNLLLHGDMKGAERLLGYNYSFSGKVVEGYQIGAKMGYPTANMKLHDDKLVPAKGVYAAWAFIDGEKHPGMLYIGTRPSFEKNDLSIEINIFEFSENLYGKVIRIEPVQHLRSDAKFDNMDELINQIQIDQIQTKNILQL